MILFRTVFLELISPFSMTLVVMTALLLMEKIYRLVNLVVEKRLDLGEVGLMLFYLLPQVLSVTLPLAVVGAVFLVIIRQSMDSEIVSLRATGRSMWSYALPFVSFGLMITIITGVMTLWLQPLAVRKFNELQVQMVRWRAENKLVPGEFNVDFGDKVIRVGGRLSKDDLTDVFISDSRQTGTSSVIFAQQGRIEVDPAEQQVVFRLRNGEVYTPEENGVDFRTVTFDTLRYVLEYKPVEKVSPRGKSTMTAEELIQGIKAAGKGSPAHTTLSLELMDRLATTSSCIAFALASIPMAVIDPRSGQSSGYLRALFLVIAYYLVWSGFRDLVYSGHIAAYAVLLPGWLILLYGLLRVRQLNNNAVSLWRVFSH